MPKTLDAPSCHGDATGRSAPEGSPVIAFVGAPNVGKSTLFNALTGARRTVGNWPGTSVEIGRGTWNADLGDGTHRTFDIIDFPGAYSLDPQTPDEALTRELLVDKPLAERPDAVVVTADAANLARSLYLAAQVRELPTPVVVALTMTDVAARRGTTVDPARLAEGLGCRVVVVDPRRRTGIGELAAAVDAALEDHCAHVPRPVDLPADADDFARADERFAMIDAALEPAVTYAAPTGRSASDRADAVLLHPVAGPLIFLATMWLVFQITTTVAAPLQDGLDVLVAGPVSAGASRLLSVLHLDHPLVSGLIVVGLIGGVGMLLTFVPLMAIMFLLLSLLEDSGYMARAAVVADRLMRALGLPGKAFLPLIVGFGCNVPAIAATRVLGDARQRLMTALLIPFTSCSARLTVYVMIASVFFPRNAGTVVFAMYVISVALVVLVGLLMRRTLWRRMGASPLVLDLPAYQVPVPRLILQATWVRVRAFLRTASGIIVATVTVVFLLQAIPAAPGYAIGQVPPELSLYGALAGVIAPVFTLAGFADWRTTGALVTGFVAKEAVISSWAQTYSLEDPSGLAAADQGRSALGQALRATFEQSSGGHPTAAVWAFMVFLLAYTPCVATLAAQKREIGLRWTAAGVAIQLSTAWLLAVLVFQTLKVVL
ncbi:ferrous iron transport protein B [Brachybacterium sp. EF45031]|nr:ferrous iron transport protein B [Brachybacterium sillae]